MLELLKTKRVPFLAFNFFLISGVLSASYLHFSFFLECFFLPLIFLLLSFLFYQRNSSVFFLCLCLASVSYGFVSTNYATSAQFRDKLVDKKEYLIMGEVISMPQLEKNEGFWKWKYPFKLKFTLRTRQLDAQEKKLNLVVNFYTREMFQLNEGEIVEFKGYVFSPYPLSNPHQFDYKKHLANNNIFYLASVRGKENFLKKQEVNFRSTREKVRNFLRQKLSLYVGNDEAKSLLLGIVLGDRRFIDGSLTDSFKKTGTMHILAISGLHLGMIALIIFSCLNFFIRSRRKLYVITGVILIAYALLVGFRPPIVRTLIMILIFFLGKIIYRESNVINSLSLASFVILCCSPLEIFSIGFLLSFVIVFFIVILTPEIEKFLQINRFDAQREKRKYYFYSIRFIAACLAAQIASIPIIAYYYQMISFVALIANVIVIALLYPIVLLGFISMLFGSFFSPLLALLNYVNAKLLFVLIKLIVCLGNVPCSFVYVPQIPFWSVFLFYGIILLFFKTKFKRVTVVLFSFLFFYLATLWWRQTHQPKVIFFDVGKGESAFVQFSNGKNMLIDCGSSSQFNVGKWVIIPYLRAQGIYKLNQIIISHFHEDHVNGLFSLMEELKIEKILIPRGKLKVNFKESILQKAKKKDILVVAVDDSCLSAGSSLKILSPPEHGVKNSNESKLVNENSMVVQVEVDSVKFLFCGDVEAKGIKYLVTKGDFLRSDVCKVAHHGGKSAVNKLFYQYVKCSEAVISTDKLKNKTIERCLSNQKIAIYRTDHNGAIEFQIDKKGYRVESIKKDAS